MAFCPKCEHSELTSANQYGFLVCNSCGYIQVQKDIVAPFWVLVRNFSKSMLFGGVLLFFAIMSVQVFVWERFGFDATITQLKIATGFGGVDEEVKLGSICNSLGDYNCSVARFMKVVDENPNHKVGLSNLAIALSKSERFEESRPYFDAYFSLGGNSFDALYWYGVSLEGLMSFEKAYPWYYYALAVNNQFISAGERLVVALKALNREFEAESLVGSLTKGQLRKYPALRKYIDAKHYDLDKGEEILLPSVDGRFHYIGIQIKESGRKYFAAVSSKSDHILIDEDILFENQIAIPEEVEETRVSTEFGVKKAKKVKIDRLTVGPWQFENIQVLVCSGCQSLIGQPILSQLNYRSEIRYQTHFLILSR